MNKRIENWTLLGICALFGLYVAIRAWILPITVDEASSAINHVSRLVVDTLFYQRDANPNNHILNTILIKISTGLFGWHHFVVRLPVMAGAVLYAWASYHLVRRISEQSWIRIFSLLLLFGNPYMLDFFSLARGYGLAIGLMAMALLNGWRYLDVNNPKTLRAAIIWAGFSVYANFTLIVFFVPFMVLMLWSSLQMNPAFANFFKQAKPSLVAIGVFALLWFVPLKRVSQSREIVHWNALGSYFESLHKSVRSATNGKPYLGGQTDLILTWFVVLGAIAIAAVAIYRWWRNRFQFQVDPRVLLVFTLIGAVITNNVEVYVSKTPFLEPRLALFYWPLFALALASTASWVSERYGVRKQWYFMAPIMVLLIINDVRNLNFRQSYEWYHDSDTFTILDYLKKTHESEGRTAPFLLDTEWFMQNSFIYHLEKGNYGYNNAVKLMPFHESRPPAQEADFYYAINSDRVFEASTNFDVVLRVPNSGLILLRKKK